MNHFPYFNLAATSLYISSGGYPALRDIFEFGCTEQS
jgi:hypothetical protein